MAIGYIYHYNIDWTRIIPTQKYSSLSSQDQCLVDASVSEITSIGQRAGVAFNNEETNVLKEAVSTPDMVKELEGRAREGKAMLA